MFFHHQDIKDSENQKKIQVLCIILKEHIIYKNFCKTVFLIIFVFCSAYSFVQNQLAFPGAEEYGKYTEGGRGGDE